MVEVKKSRAFPRLFSPRRDQGTTDWASLERLATGGGRVAAPNQGVQSVTASAKRLTNNDLKTSGGVASNVVSADGWQDEAWDMFDLIGELHFSATTLAGRMAQAAFYVGRRDPSTPEEADPVRVEDPDLQNLLYSIGKGPAGMSQLVVKMGMNLFVAGACWIVGIPPHLYPGTDDYKRTHAQADGLLAPVDREAPAEHVDEGDTVDLVSMVWKVFSLSEVTQDQSSKIGLVLEDGSTIKVEPSEVYPVRVWRPHPRKSGEADSPTRASLITLRELLGMSMMVSAQLDSRLAGAGLLLINREDSAALKRAQGLAENDQADPLLDALTEAMITPIKDREAASATVPLIVTVGDVDKAAKHIAFSTPLDQHVKELREDAIRRLALGLDMPPELLLGVSGMNHWGAWLIREDTVETHLKPPLELICDALTEQFLRPVLEATGRSPEEAAEFSVWYSVEHLISRPNRTEDAKDLFAAGGLRLEELAGALGFGVEDMPDQDPHKVAVDLVLRMVQETPSLMVDPGLGSLFDQVYALLSGGVVPSVPSPEAEATSEGVQSVPTTGGDPMVVPDGN